MGSSYRVAVISAIIGVLIGTQLTHFLSANTFSYLPTSDERSWESVAKRVSGNSSVATQQAFSNLVKLEVRLAIAKELLLEENGSDDDNTNTNDNTNNNNNTTIVMTPTQRVIFYNIFIPEGDAGQALRIVQEQLEKKNASTLVAMAPIHYTLIGQEVSHKIQQLCGSRCHLLQYVPIGNEVLTLDSLYDFCQDHPNSLVSYIHDKGSYHPSDANDRFRVLNTKAVFSDQCQNIGVSSSGRCNICSARFTAVPHFHITGNMFTAQCSYVKQLISPSKFEAKMKAFFEYIFSEENVSLPKPVGYKDMPWLLGASRYAVEHWLGSHPRLKPCDVYPDDDYMWGQKGLPDIENAWIPQLNVGPRLALSKFDKGWVRGEWFCGQARLAEFEFLYGSKPEPDSFVWSYYSQTTLNCPTPLMQALPATTPPKAPPENNSQRVVFYNVFIPKDAASNALRIVQEQLQQKEGNALLSSAPIYYTLIGPDITLKINKMCGDNCRRLKHALTGDEVLTLDSLYEYCQEHSDVLVTYMHNKGSFHQSETNDLFQNLNTKGAVSSECQSIASSDQCNICGARFAALPHTHMSGNMWTAKCSYIKQLIRPSDFVGKMEAFFEYILSDKNDGHLPKPQEEYRRKPWIVGRGRYALEHWLGSHPSIKPCDVYPDKKYFFGEDNLPGNSDAWSPELRAAPRIELSIFSVPRYTAVQNWWMHGDWFCGHARLAEFEFLYHQKPTPDSFVWSYYSHVTKNCPIPISQPYRSA